MRREILVFRRGWQVSGCCPGHDVFPNDVYASNRSKRARARDIKREHRYARHVLNRLLERV